MPVPVIPLGLLLTSNSSSDTRSAGEGQSTGGSQASLGYAVPGQPGLPSKTLPQNKQPQKLPRDLERGHKTCCSSRGSNIECPAPASDHLEPAETPGPGDVMLSSGACVHLCMLTHRYINKNLKIFLIFKLVKGQK